VASKYLIKLVPVPDADPLTPCLTYDCAFHSSEDEEELFRAGVSAAVALHTFSEIPTDVCYGSAVIYNRRTGNVAATVFADAKKTNLYAVVRNDGSLPRYVGARDEESEDAKAETADRLLMAALDVIDRKVG
jgi:hypothetical protein